MEDVRGHCFRFHQQQPQQQGNILPVSSSFSGFKSVKYESISAVTFPPWRERESLDCFEKCSQTTTRTRGKVSKVCLLWYDMISSSWWCWWWWHGIWQLIMWTKTHHITTTTTATMKNGAEISDFSLRFRWQAKRFDGDNMLSNKKMKKKNMLPTIKSNRLAIRAFFSSRDSNQPKKTHLHQSLVCQETGGFRQDSEFWWERIRLALS